MPEGKGTKRLADGATKARGNVKRPAEPEPPSAEAQAAVAESEAKQAQLADELRTVEKQIYDLETRYIATANPQGNALKGYEGFLSQSSAPARRGPVKPEERLFSSSSVTGASHLPA